MVQSWNQRADSCPQPLGRKDGRPRGSRPSTRRATQGSSRCPGTARSRGGGRVDALGPRGAARAAAGVDRGSGASTRGHRGRRRLWPRCGRAEYLASLGFATTAFDLSEAPRSVLRRARGTRTPRSTTAGLTCSRCPGRGPTASTWWWRSSRCRRCPTRHGPSRRRRSQPGGAGWHLAGRPVPPRRQRAGRRRPTVPADRGRDARPCHRRAGPGRTRAVGGVEVARRVPPLAPVVELGPLVGMMGPMAIHITGDEQADQVLDGLAVRAAAGHAPGPAVPDGARVPGPGEDPRPVRQPRAGRDRGRRPRAVRLAVRRAAGRAPVPGLDGRADPGRGPHRGRGVRRPGRAHLDRGGRRARTCSGG